MDYEKASDFDINKAVAELIYRECIELEIFQNTYKASTADVVSQGVHITSFDLNNPSDAWPIITSNAIDIEFAVDSLGGIGQAHVYVEGDTDLFWEFNDNSKALRAACIVYLMMQEKGL